MKLFKSLLLVALAGMVGAAMAMADMEAQKGAPTSGDWLPRDPVTPDPSKVVVPDGYKVSVWKAGLDTPVAGAFDGEGNFWVTAGGALLGSPEELEPAHVKVFSPTGELIREIGKGTFQIMNEIEYCEENGKMYIPDYAGKIYEMDGVNGELELVMTDFHIGDHRMGGLDCKDGYLYFALGWPSNTGFADPDNHGWPDIPNDPFWVKHDDGLPNTPHDAPCRRIVHTGLNIESSDGRMTGGMMPVGVAAEPGQVIEPQTPCHGSIQRVRLEDDKNSEGMYPHSAMETYAYGFRNQSGVEFGPEGSRFENALAVSDNGANDLGHRRIANGAEKLWIVTEKGQSGGYPDKEGMTFVTNKRFGWDEYNGSPVYRPYPQLYIGDEPFIPEMPPYRFQHHVEGVRGVPLIVANKNPDGYINPVLEWDTNNPIDGVSWSAGNFGADNHLFGAVYGILDTGPESLVPTWPAVLDIEFLNPTGIKWSYFARNIEMGPNAYLEEENRGGLERPNDVDFTDNGRTMLVVDYGEVFTDFEMPSPFYTTPGTGVIWKIEYTGQ